MSTLSILCVSKFGPHSQRFIERMKADAVTLGATFVLGADGPLPDWWTGASDDFVVLLKSDGCIESVLDEAVAACPDGYILRLDDDEAIGPPMLDWLASRAYEAADHWAFPRMHLMPDEQHYIVNPPLWPDLQTRLSVKAKSAGRTAVHQPSPYGTGQVAGVAIEHHKFLVRPRAEREALLEHYERLQTGAGEQFDVFSVPERYAVTVEPVA